MKNREYQRGFTLVELAIVLILIGIVSAGVLKAQTMLRNSRITATIAQVQNYKAAGTIFKDSYGGLPGDSPYADIVLPNCPTPACAYKHPNYAGDKSIGMRDWSSHLSSGDVYPQQGGHPLTTIDASGSAPMQVETVLFWVHLALADLISGIDVPRALTATTNSGGVTHPTAKMGGVFWISYAKSGASVQQLPGIPAPVSSHPPPTGHLVGITTGPMQGYTALAGRYPLTVRDAADIDQKMDDGSPTDGVVRGFGRPDCFLDADTYNPNSNGRNCSVTFVLFP